MVGQQFAAWDTQLDRLQSEESRELAAERRSNTAATYDAIQERIGKLREQWQPFITDLRDIRQYLKGDLSPKGLATMKPTAERVDDQQHVVVAILDELIARIGQALG